MPPVAVRIFHPLPDAAAGRLVRWVAAARTRNAERQRRGFERLGVANASIVSGPPDGRPFGARLRDLVADLERGGLVAMGSGSIPMANAADRRALIEAAGSGAPRALVNSRYSADVVAISAIERLSAIPDIPADNALPRWLAEEAGIPVADLGRRWRLALDIDGPVDVVLTGGCDEAEDADGSWVDLGRITEVIDAVRHVAHDRRAELLIAGRSSAGTLGWLERHTPSRTRALIEERGLRAAGLATQRPPASVLGALLDRDGPASFGPHLGRLADAAIVDTRILLAHRLGANEAIWPSAEDRFASDLLLAEDIADPWLRDLTASAATAEIPILLGGHTVVGPGVRLIVGRSWT